MPLAICLCLYVFSEPRVRKLRPLCLFLFAATIADFLLGRRMHLAAAAEGGMDISEVDLGHVGSTFTRMTIFAMAFMMSWMFRRGILRNFMRIIPMAMFVVNILFVTLVVTTQSGNQAKDVTMNYSNLEERFTYKLFGDRATVWTMGWEEVKAAPYVFKDLREFIVFDPKRGATMKLLPHNQFLTLLGREGFWLGLTLSLFIVWIQVRAFRCFAQMEGDKLFASVFLPVSSSVFFAVGITGQTVLSSNMWGDGLATIVMPGIVYGKWLCMKRSRPSALVCCRP